MIITEKTKVKTAHKVVLSCDCDGTGRIIEAAENVAIGADQDWDLGLTRFGFEDNSFLVVSEGDFAAVDADNLQSVLAYKEWVSKLPGKSSAENQFVDGVLESLGAAAMGRKGGSSKSAAKKAAVKENGKKGGRPKKSITDRIVQAELEKKFAQDMRDLGLL